MAGATRYEYDGRGNLIAVYGPSSTIRYTWDAADRLITVNGPSSIVQYTYDADGRRVRQTATVNGQSSTVEFLWDEASPYGDVLLESEGSHTTAYTLAGTELLSQAREGIIHYYLPDGQGSVRTLTDSSGLVSDTYTYSAFGELLSRSGTTVNAYLYTAQRCDAASGLYDLRARVYDPALGRFLSRDPLEPIPAQPRELNRYVYTANNNPINAADPSGYQAATATTYPHPNPLPKGEGNGQKKQIFYRKRNYLPVTASERSERGRLLANAGDCFGMRPRHDTRWRVSSRFWLPVGSYQKRQIFLDFAPLSHRGMGVRAIGSYAFCYNRSLALMPSVTGNGNHSQRPSILLGRQRAIFTSRPLWRSSHVQHDPVRHRWLARDDRRRLHFR